MAAKKQPGCFLILMALAVIWAIGFWLLWKASMSRPAPADKEEGSSAIFEIIPGSDERTSVEDGMEDRGGARGSAD